MRKAVLAVLVTGVLTWTAVWTALGVDNLGAADASASERDIVVVVHGLGRSKSAMWLLASRIEEAGYRVARVGYSSLRQTPEEILDDIAGQIAACCHGTSPNVHFVGHSLGGLLIRAYLAEHRIANLGRVVLIGTPNTGSEIVDNLGHKWWFRVLGPMARGLGTSPDSFPGTIGEPDYPVGVIAGVRNGRVNEDLLPGEDDGLVTVESTRIDGMADFAIVNAGHAALRYDKAVAKYTMTFLRTGSFGRQ